ncbi:MAG: putative peptidoglycan glycosyltransferase FtsW [Candidatus Limnocylindrales bacterium]
MNGRLDRWRAPANSVPRERVQRSSGPSRPSAVSASQASVLANPSALKRDAHEPEYIILVTVVALSAIGILMVYSASAIPSYAQSQNTFQLVAPQVLAGVLGLAAMVFLMRVDYRYLRVVSVPLALLAIILLAVVLLPLPGPLRNLSVSSNGAARWLHLGPFLPDIHPAEVAKLALVVYLSHWLATRGKGIRSFFHGTVPFAIIVVPFLVLVAREPDLGTAAVIVLIAFSLFFVAGANVFHLALAGLAGLGGAVALVLAVGSYPLQRIQTLLDPWADPQGSGYQTVKGLEALSAGGLFGTGLGNDRIFVPGDVNDFIFSVIAQELGLVGGAVVIGLFVAFAYAGIRTAIRAPDTFGGLMAAGITAWICFQALINIGVVVAVVPVTGITLPFVSAGGSSLTVSLAAVGILLSISRETVERGWVSASADSGRGYGGTYLPGSRRRPIAAG